MTPKNQYAITPTVQAVGNIPFHGNIIPQKWFSHLVKESGKPDAIAAIVLSEIVYWYRPAEVRDETSGAIVEYRKRFKADLLQRSYESFAEQFGFSKNQIKAAFATLKDTGVVDTDFRTIEANGTRIGNVMFIRVIPERLAAITLSDPMEEKLNRCGTFSEQVSPKNGIPVEEKVDTNTETTHRLHREGDSTPTETKTDPKTGIEEGTYFGMEDPRKRWNNFGRRGQIAEYNQAVPAKERTALADAFAEAYGWAGLIDGSFGDDKKLDQCHRWAIQAYQMGVTEPQRVIAAWEHWQKTDWRAVKAKEQGDDNPRPESDQLIQHISANVATKKQTESRPKKRKVARPAGYTWGS